MRPRRERRKGGIDPWQQRRDGRTVGHEREMDGQRVAPERGIEPQVARGDGADLGGLDQRTDVMADRVDGPERGRAVLARHDPLGLELVAAAGCVLEAEVRQALVPRPRGPRLLRRRLRRLARDRVSRLGGARRACPRTGGSGRSASVIRRFTQTCSIPGPRQVVNRLTLSPAARSSSRDPNAASNGRSSNTSWRTRYAGWTAKVTAVTTPRAPRATTLPAKRSASSSRAKVSIAPSWRTSSRPTTSLARLARRTPDPCVPVATDPGDRDVGQRGQVGEREAGLVELRCQVAVACPASTLTRPRAGSRSTRRGIRASETRAWGVSATSLKLWRVPSARMRGVVRTSSLSSSRLAGSWIVWAP